MNAHSSIIYNSHEVETTGDAECGVSVQWNTIQQENLAKYITCYYMDEPHAHLQSFSIPTTCPEQPLFYFLSL